MLKKLHRNKGSGEESSVELTPTPEERSPDPKTEAEISRSVVVYDTEHVVSHGGTSQYKKDEVSLMTSLSSLVKMTHISIRPVFRNHHPTSKPKPYLAASSCMVPNTSFPMAALASTTGMGLAPQLADSQHSILRGSSSLWNKVVCKIQLSYRPCWLASA